MIGGAMLLGVMLTTGLALVGPRALWAQGGGQAREYLVLAYGGQETPAVDTLGVASGKFTLSADRTTLAYDLVMSGLKGKFTAMHLHRGRVGQAGDVVYPLAAPDNNGQAKGQVAFNAADEADLNNQGFYLNIHTDLFPNGEIRSQVVASPVAATPAVPLVSFSNEIRPILNANCSCHTGGRPEQGLNVVGPALFTTAVNVKSVQSPLDRIEPGDPAKSYLIHKLRNTQRTVGGSGVRMPFGGPALAPAAIQLIETWISQGAQNN
jgi:hypothetical protein